MKEVRRELSYEPGPGDVFDALVFTLLFYAVYYVLPWLEPWAPKWYMGFFVAMALLQPITYFHEVNEYDDVETEVDA